MKIERIETFANRFVAFVRVTEEDGAQGWGQISTYNSDISARVASSAGRAMDARCID